MYNDYFGGAMGMCVNVLGWIVGVITIANIMEAFIMTFIGAFAGIAATHLFNFLVKKIQKAWKK